MSLAPITLAGTGFQRNGKPFYPVGVSAFSEFARFRQSGGWDALVKPNFTMWRNIATAGGFDGPIILRVFRGGGPWNRFHLEPWSYADGNGRLTALADFSRRAEDFNFYLDWTAGDWQVVLPEKNGPRGQQQHLNESCAALAGCTNVFCIQVSNEDFKNGQLSEVNRVIPPKWGSYLTDSGAYFEIDAWRSRASLNLDMLDYHGTRATDWYWPKWLVDMPVQQAILLEAFGKPVVLKEPYRCDPIGASSREPDQFQVMGQLVRLGGNYFHSMSGRDGDGLTTHERDCAIAYFDGARSACSLKG